MDNVAFNAKQLMKMYDLYSNNGIKKCFYISGDYFENIDDVRLRFWMFNSIKTILDNELNSNFVLYYYQNERKILVIEMVEGQKKLTILFPYKNWDKHIRNVIEINKLVSSDGACVVFSNNNPYNLEFGICISTTENFEKIKGIVHERDLKIDYSRGIEEIARQSFSMGYNLFSLDQSMPDDVIEILVKKINIIPPQSEIDYGKVPNRKKRIFVSYSHKDKDLVYKIVDELRELGLDFWLDIEQIDYGDDMFERIHEGMRSSELPLLFISHATKESLFASYELKNFLQKVIYDHSITKKWVIIKLDNVNLDEIMSGLNIYKYFDYEKESLSDLVSVLNKKMK